MSTIKEKGNVIFSKKHREMTEEASMPSPSARQPLLYIWVELCIPKNIPKNI